jgi:hypothetical protein
MKILCEEKARGRPPKEKVKVLKEKNLLSFNQKRNINLHTFEYSFRLSYN